MREHYKSWGKFLINLTDFKVGVSRFNVNSCHICYLYKKRVARTLPSGNRSFYIIKFEMPIPTRSAPRPPSSNFEAQNNSSAWSNNDPFGCTSTMQPIQKKKPPPRPPPPRFRKENSATAPTAVRSVDDRSKKPARPTELLTNLFGRKSQHKQENVNVAYTRNHTRLNNPSSQSTNGPNHFTTGGPSVSLIDLSPPGSPTFTTRSSSDGVSVDSFGSDGNSNPSVFTSSGNTSQTESAFEDDFDFFSSLSSGKSASTAGVNDPWKMSTSQDPFSPFSPFSPFFPSSPSSPSSPFSPLSNGNLATAGTKRIGIISNNDTLTSIDKGFNPPILTNYSIGTMPTIIRARPPKPPAPKNLNRNLAPIVTDFNNSSRTFSSSSNTTNVPFSSSTGDDSLCLDTEWPVENFHNNPSPPMPSIPPPPPPPPAAAAAAAAAAAPSPFQYLPPRNEATSEKQRNESLPPHGIALYDFEASQSGDLALKQGELVTLLSAINDEWLQGRIGNRVGIFPANFVNIVIPLGAGSCWENIVNALYTFTGETWQDLPFEEGAKIKVLERISDDWLYGEYRGKKGQFPANYVDRVPQQFTGSS